MVETSNWFIKNLKIQVLIFIFKGSYFSLKITQKVYACIILNCVTVSFLLRSVQMFTSKSKLDTAIWNIIRIKYNQNLCEGEKRLI